MYHLAVLLALLSLGCAATPKHTTPRPQFKLQEKTCKLIGQHPSKNTVILITQNCLADKLMSMIIVVTSKNGAAAGTEAAKWKIFYFGKKRLHLLFKSRVRNFPMYIFGTRRPKKHELRWRTPKPQK